MIFLPDAENRTIVSSFIWTNHRNLTSRQTDGRTDKIALAITAVRIASNADARCDNSNESRGPNAKDGDNRLLHSEQLSILKQMGSSIFRNEFRLSRKPTRYLIFF